MPAGAPTEHPTVEGKLYLCAVKDVWFRRIVGYSIDSRMASHLAVDALEMAIARRGRERRPGAWSTRTEAARVNSTGRRNTSIMDVFSSGDGGLAHEDQRCTGGASSAVARADRALRPQMRSPGRPEPSRAVQRQFWQLIATSITSAEAAVRVGMSVPVGSRWFRHAGGMPPICLAEPTGRYLSFEEREDIAILRARDQGVREIARAIGGDPGTISRELSPQRRHSGREATQPRSVKSVEVVYEVDPSVGRVGQAVMAGSSGSSTSSTMVRSTAWARAMTSSPR